MRALNGAGNPPPPARPCAGAVRWPPEPGAPFLFPPTEPAVLSEGSPEKSLCSRRLAAAPSSTSSLSRKKVGVIMGTAVPAGRDGVRVFSEEQTSLSREQSSRP